MDNYIESLLYDDIMENTTPDHIAKEATSEDNPQEAVSKPDSKHSKIAEENTKLRYQLGEAVKEIRKLQEEKKLLLEENTILTTNISALYRTASCEIKKLQRGSKGVFPERRRDSEYAGKLPSEKYRDRGDKKRRHQSHRHRRPDKDS